jgi:hypothetical protein
MVTYHEEQGEQRLDHAKFSAAEAQRYREIAKIIAVEDKLDGGCSYSNSIELRLLADDEMAKAAGLPGVWEKNNHWKARK